MTTFKIHGDNIVECERIAKIILAETSPHSTRTFLMSPSTIVIEFSFSYADSEEEWRLELLPGFNKAGRHRWPGNIFDALRNSGSFLDETPDAIITRMNGSREKILCVIESCSALQAGNQAWQRSGRALSIGRTGCPYLYIVDFVKYELDKSTRKRKALRFPNAAVPYSYISFSKTTGNFVAQLYVRAEEFDKMQDTSLCNFDEDNFADAELAAYLVKLMQGKDTSAEEKNILRKNLNVVLFLAQRSSARTNFTVEEWSSLCSANADGIEDIVDFAVQEHRFSFHKKTAAKSQHGKTNQVLSFVDRCSMGLASRDLPIGIIPSTKRPLFAAYLKKLYPSFNDSIISKIADNSKHLILCIAKGFKPRGDDNRPDRGLLPFAVMLSSTGVEVMTYLYGPLLARNYNLLMHAPKRLASSNGLWKSMLGLSNYVILDVPVLNGGELTEAELLLDTTDLKGFYTNSENITALLEKEAFPSIPLEYHEDDVDTGIHYIFTHLLADSCFEGMCNPPGGDWSAFSVLFRGTEMRWLSLPRVSKGINGKRPDHILEIFGVFEKPLLLSIESKEQSADLERNVGIGLVNYIRSLMDYVPNVERIVTPTVGMWTRATKTISPANFEIISAAAYLKEHAQSNHTVFANSQCDMLFIMEPKENGWEIEIVPSDANSEKLKHYLLAKMYQGVFQNITWK